MVPKIGATKTFDADDFPLGQNSKIDELSPGVAMEVLCMPKPQFPFATEVEGVELKL